MSHIHRGVREWGVGGRVYSWELGEWSLTNSFCPLGFLFSFLVSIIQNLVDITLII